MALRRTERGLDRLVNFSDATVAIAITLLILPLVDVAAEDDDGDVATLFSDNVGTFLAFGITFVVIGRFWMLHHDLFEHVQGYHAPLLWANLLWLASIVFLPFAANVLSHADGGAVSDAPVFALYIATMIVTSGSMLWMRVLFAREPQLLAREARDQLKVAPAAVAVGTLVVALALAVLVPQVGMFWLLLLVLARPATALAQRLALRG